MRNLKSFMPRSLVSMIALLLAVVFCMSALVSCDNGGDESSNTSGSEASGEKATYTVSVKSNGGVPLSGLDIYIYKGAELKDMKEFSKTNENGEITFSLPKSDDYFIVVSGAPKGYKVEKSYGFVGTSSAIVLTSSLVTGEDISTAQLGIGDVMYDFTVMNSEGQEVKLSEVFKTKKLVVLNFWYTTCSWCLEEFPLMEELYRDYKEDVEIIALDPLDDANAVKSFRAQHGLSFPMAACPSSWSAVFGVQGYPTSVFIDRYGTICIVESGAITSKRPWISAFDHFTADNYKQKICTNGIGDLVSQVKPTYTMDTTENISALINNGDIEVTYRAETDSDTAEFTWPFIAGEKLGENCIYASNKGIDGSYAIIYADVTLKKGQAVGFDYLVSSEYGCDIMYVIVDDDDIYQISGVSDKEEWKSCYPCVAEEDGTYEIALCFLKDEDGTEGDDTVYIKNMRVVDEKDIDTDSYLPRYAATSEDGFEFDYVDVVFNEKDGYYHVGSANGPLLLADLMGYTQFNEEKSVFDIVTAGDADKGGVSLYNKVAEGGLGMVDYFSYASNSRLNGVCTVNKELGEMLKQVAEVAGFEDDSNEWLKICKYFKAYGKGNTQLEDPIKGLATFSAYETKLGKNVSTNYFQYDRAIIPRGMFSRFTPSKSGVYRFSSKSDYAEGIDAWIFNEKGEIIYTYELSERMWSDSNNCSMVYYMEAGKSYYINMAFWDVYATGRINYDVEYLGATYKLFRSASPGYFTYDSDATGEVMYDVISGGITPVLKDGKYYDSEDGSLIYADFTGVTNLFGHSIVEMIEMGGFDFSKSETDGEVLAYLKQNDNDVEKTKEYLKKLWGEEYDANADIYQLEDVFSGRYHGKGEDLTEEIRAYKSKMDKSSTEKDGCVVVDERLVEILQKLMDKYTFEGVENSWLKVCYYYDYLGPAK